MIIQSNLNEVLELIRKNCQPYIKSLRQCDKYKALVRGSNDSINMIEKYNHNLEYRTPRNMPLSIHNKINNKFESIFNWKIRNGVFCFGYDLNNEAIFNLGYGVNYLLFPLGDYEFVYSPNIFDLYEYFCQSNEETAVKLNNLFFYRENLNDAMKSGDEENGFSNEISLRTNEYYLIDFKLKNIIIKDIWG